MKAPLSPAEATAVLLLEPGGGPAVMIPGAFEKRVRIPAISPAPEADVPAAPLLRTVSESDRGRLEREREGGGAPSQRAGRRRGTLASRLWQSVIRPTRLFDIWRRVTSYAGA
jgi:hypothetical protein